MEDIGQGDIKVLRRIKRRCLNCGKFGLYPKEIVYRMGIICCKDYKACAKRMKENRENEYKRIWKLEKEKKYWTEEQYALKNDILPNKSR